MYIIRPLSFNIDLEKGCVLVAFKVERQEYINKTFRIEKKLVNKLDKICDEKNISLNKLIVLCINYALENLEEDNKDK